MIQSEQNLKNKILSSMKLLKISPKRSLGQNFLINNSIVNTIVQVAEPESFEKIFEVGPGFGSLTNLLKEKNKNLTLLEIDKKLCHFWIKQGLETRQVDALSFEWERELNFKGDKLLVSNLPYQIASRLLVELSILEQSFDRMILMFQKEVAQRILAKTGTRQYGFLTVIAKSFWNIHCVLEAGTVDFFPKPRVASQVLCFDRKKKENLDSILKKSTPSESGEKFHDFVKKTFTNRRKKLLPKLTDYAEKNKLIEIFKKMNIKEDVRAENLNTEQFIEIALQLGKLRENSN